MYFAPFLEVIIPLLLLVTGTYQSVVYWMLKKHFKSWPLVAAEIVFKKLYDVPHPILGREYEAIVHFRYDFRGEEYVSETPFLKGYMLFSNMASEQSILKAYEVGDLVNVRVHPKASDVAYIDVKPIHWLSTILVPIGALLYIAFIYGYFALFMEVFFAR